MKRRTTSLLAVGTAATALLSPGTATADEGPNGQIAYVDSEFCCETDHWVVNEDGSDPHNVTDTDTALEYDPVWSPDGTKIAYTRYEDEFAWAPDIWVMNADGSEQTNLTNTCDRRQPEPASQHVRGGAQSGRLCAPGERPTLVIAPPCHSAPSAAISASPSRRVAERRGAERAERALRAPGGRPTLVIAPPGHSAPSAAIGASPSRRVAARQGAE